MTSGSLLLASVLVLKGATVHPASGPAIPDGTVVVEDGRVAAVGGPELPVPEGAEVRDLAGKHLSPPLFVPATALGLVEIAALEPSVDVAETAGPRPDSRPDAAMNLDSELLPVARSGGLLHGLLVPSGSVLPGSAAAVRLNGWTREDACLACPAAVVVEWPRMAIDRSKDARPSARKQEKARDEAISTIRTAFRDAAAYRRAKAAEASGGPVVPRDARLAALVPALDGTVPLLVRARTKREIEAVLRFVDEDLAAPPGQAPVRLVLLGAADAWRLAPRLGERKVGVVLDGTLVLPERPDEPYDTPFAAAGVLEKAGVLVAITNGSDAGGAAQARELPVHAAVAAAHGLDRVAALRTITLNPARLFGLSASLGSIEPGKEASFAVWSGDPLDGRSAVEALFDRGAELDLSDRQKRLRDRYRDRPKPGR